VKIQCKRQDLSRGLSIVGHAVSTRSTLPVLANLLIVTEGDAIRLSATNLEIAITCRVPAHVEVEGSTTVPAKLLTDFVNALSVGEVELNPLPGTTPGVRVRGGSSEANIRGMDAAEFPSIPQIEGTEKPIILDAAELRGMISQTTFAAATDEARPVFTAVLTRIRDGRLIFAAADTFRLAVRTTVLPGSEDQSMDLLIPGRALNDLARIIPSEGSVEIFTTSARNQVLFRAPNVEMVAHLQDGQFPNYEAILPKSHTTRAVIPTDQLRNAAKVASLFAKDATSTNTVKVIVTPGQEGLTPGVVTLQATSDDVGDATGTVDATVDGPEVSILFNVRYMNDVLGVISTPEVIFELNTAQTPGVVKPMGSDGYVYVIMPLYNRG
jgi:DNA polymerase-3 subunit beta